MAHVNSDLPYTRTAPERNGENKLADVYKRKTVDETLEALGGPSPEDGWDRDAVAQMRESSGTNELDAKAPEPLYERWLSQFKEPMNALLVSSAIVSLLVGQADDAICIAVALTIVITVGIAQEYRSEKSLEALNNLVPPQCSVVREGRSQAIVATELVPGDIVRLRSGDRVPADVRLLHVSDFEVDESALTGETTSVRKTTKPVDDEPNNLAFMGTLVQRGSATAVVYAIGPQTEFGSIFGMVDDVTEKQTPLQRAMGDLAQRLSTASLVIIAVILLLGVLERKSWLEMFTIAVSLAVAAIPEGLPIVVTVTLALGALEMSHRQAIVKKLPSVETLGCMSIICSDKTGTLTTGQMEVVEAYTVPDGIVRVEEGQTPSSQALLKTIQVGFFCNNATKNEQGEWVGQATETAMVALPEALGMNLRHQAWTRTNEVPFDSVRKCMVVTGHGDTSETPGEAQLVKGAPEVVLKKCSAYMAQQVTNLNDSVRHQIQEHADNMARRGLRVLATGFAPQGRPFVFCGLQAMQDPPREGVSDAIKTLQRGGVQVVMITGDAKTTARAIAEQLGIASSPEVLTGPEVESMSDRQLQEHVQTVSVFARTKPEHKLRIVSALQANQYVVGMTGDGVNDAPALKLADVGIAMGTGTDVTKEAADVILVDDNFATILSAVREGKSIFYNIQNFVGFQLSTSAAALILITLSTVLGFRFPMNATQILFINILMDGPPSQSLGVDPAQEQVMDRPPRLKDAPVLTRRLFMRTLFSALLMIVMTEVTFLLYRPESGQDTHTSSMTFSAFVVLDLVTAWQNRGLFIPLFGNHVLLWTLGGSLLTQFALVYVPLMQSVFHTESLPLNDLGYLACIAALAFGAQELRRRYERRLEREQQTRSPA